MPPTALLMCRICLDKKSVIPNDYFVLTNCDRLGGHVFHQTCIADWLTLSRSCPVCNNSVGLEDLSRLYGCDPSNRMLVLTIAVLGDSGVGKTSLIKRFQRDILVDNQLVRLTLWDPSGQERYHSVIPQCVRDCHGILFCYDKIHFETLSNICRIWMVFAANYVRYKEFASILLECRNDLTRCTLDLLHRGDPNCRPVTNVAKRASIELLKAKRFSTCIVNSTQDDLEAPFVNLVRRILANDALMEQIENNEIDATFQIQEGDGEHIDSWCIRYSKFFKKIGHFFTGYYFY